MSDNVIVLMTNELYIDKCLRTVGECRNIGKYSGDIVIISHPELQDNTAYIQSCSSLRAVPVFFPLIDLQNILSKIKECPFNDTDGRELNKTFQWQKVQLFNTYFKQWNKLFYMDAGMRIIQDINIFFSFIRPNIILAHCDTYPLYDLCIMHQFNKTSRPELFAELSEKYNLNRTVYQTGIMLFNTDIIQENTMNDLMILANKYPISRNNEQGIMNLYFMEQFTQVPIFHENRFLYDYWERFGMHGSRYTIMKYPRTI
jgi:hypothetical protein